MLFRFQSQATAELIMLEADARAALHLIGKSITTQGVISADQLPQAINALQEAWQEDHDLRRREDEAAPNPQRDAEEVDPNVRLSQRLVPLVTLLKQANQEGTAVRWTGA